MLPLNIEAQQSQRSARRVDTQASIRRDNVPINEHVVFQLVFAVHILLKPLCHSAGLPFHMQVTQDEGK